MALVLANRVQETGTANTTVSFTLAGAVAGFQSFAAIGNTNTTYYSATDGSGNWEVGLGTYSTTGPTLTRTTVYASSNSGSAVTFSGAVNIFVTYPSGRSVNLNESGNVSALGTVSSGTWQGSTVGVAYGGTGVTASSGANSVVLRDANENITVNRLSQGLQTITASGGTTVLTAASDFNQQLVGTTGHTFQLPDATTLTDTTTFQFNNNATGTLTIQNNAATTVGTVAPGGAAGIALMNNSTSGGTWDVHGYIPENVTWGTNALDLGSTVITGGTWNGGTITPAYGGTGLTSFTTNGAVYATGTTTLTSGTLPVISGGTGTTSVPTNGQLLIGNGSTYTVASLGSGTGISTTVGSGTLTVNNTGVTSLAGTSPVTASASTGSVTMSLASGYGDTQNPYASKTANFFLAAPNGSAGAPTFRAVVAADIPTLNQNTTGSAGSVANAVTFNNGGTGDASGTTFNGSAARTISYNTVGAPSTGGANATGTWGISISGNAATATTASNVNNGTLTLAVSGTGLSGSASFTANQSGNSTFTVTSNATSANTASTIVARDASGNFSAGTITATLSGSATSAGSVSNSVTFNNGGAGGASGSTFNGSGALTVSYNTVGAPSTTGTNASGTWGISISGNAATATSATSATNASNLTGGNISGAMTGTMAAGSQVLELANNDNYLSARVIRNNASTSNRDGMYIGYGNSNSGITRIYGGGATSGGIEITGNGVNNVTIAGSVALNAGNYNSYAPTLTGGGASGTWGIAITGNAATASNASNTNSISNAVGGSYTWTGVQYFQANQNTTGSNPPLQAFSTGGNGAIMSFHRGGYYAVNFGLDSDNVMRIGGWSAAANLWQLDMSGNEYLSGSSRAPIFYDSNNTGYYLDPASTSELNKVYYNSNMVSRDYGIGQIGRYASTIYQAVWSMGESYLLPANGANTGNLYGIAWSYPGGQGGASNNLASHGMLILENGVFKGAWGGGSLRTPGDVRGTIFYDWDNTGYYLDPAGTSRLNTTETDQSYTYGWFRNYSSNTGLYNQSTTQHLSSNANGYWDMSSTTTVSSIRFYTGGHLGALRGYVYADTGNNIGFLDATGSWRLRVVAGDYTLAEGSSMRAPLFYDSNNTAYYTDPASTSQLNVLACAGNITSSGTITASSDERLKTNWRDLPADFVEQLAKVKAGVYDRVDEEGMTQVGVSAQSLQTLMPNAVTQNADGMLGVAYGNAALVAAVKLAERVLQLEQRIKQLERIA